MVLLPVRHQSNHMQLWLLGSQQPPVQAHLLGANVVKKIFLATVNRNLTWLTANPPGFWPQTHQPSGFEGGDKPGAQLVGFEQATTINTLKIGKYT